MKSIHAFRAAMAALIAATSLTVWSQTSEPASASATAASRQPTPATGRKANRALRRQIYGAIAKHKEINAGNISVVAKDGAVKLTGTVTDASQVDRVGEIARGVQGVTSVTNGLTVEKPLGGM